ncbi:hypothetical protein_gp227 [Bacillus phage vB_BceM_WH1]|nr:hypothetical protein_gp227 [Bacillus phage vB_BceM_WH1]
MKDRMSSSNITKEALFAVEISEGKEVPTLYLELEHAYYPYITYTHRPKCTISLPHPIHPRAVKWCDKYNIPYEPHWDKDLAALGYGQSNYCTINMITKAMFEKVVPRKNEYTFHKLREEEGI